MNRRTTTVLALVLFAALSVFGGSANTTSAVAGNAHANGGGTTVEGTEKSTFVFNAVQQIDGSVVGHLTYHFRSANVTFHMQNDCLNIIGNSAVITGTVTMVTGTSIPFIVPGARGIFQVQDNGEGSNATSPDLISDVIIYPPMSVIDCRLTPAPAPYLPIDGNIDVKP
jgi:hypothetical protein